MAKVDFYLTKISKWYYELQNLSNSIFILHYFFLKSISVPITEVQNELSDHKMVSLIPNSEVSRLPRDKNMEIHRQKFGSVKRCPHWRGVPITEVSPMRGSTVLWDGILTSGSIMG